MKIVLVSASFIFAATPVLAESPADPARVEKKICRSERITGSLARVNRICKTAAEWDHLSRETQKDLNDFQRNSGAIPRTIPDTPEDQLGRGGMTAGTG